MATEEQVPDNGAPSGDQAAPASPQHSQRRPLVITRLLLWLIFGVALGGLPLMAEGVKEAFSAGGFSFTHLLDQGELFIISAVIAAGAMGELLVARIPDRERNFGILAGGSCFLLCVGNTIAYTTATVTVTCAVAEERTNNATSALVARTVAAAQRAACADSAVFAHSNAVAHLSVWFFVPTVFLSAACIGMAAGR